MHDLPVRAPQSSRAARIVPQQCDNAANLHNRRKPAQKSHSRQHRVRKRSMGPAVVLAGRQVLSVGSADNIGGVFSVHP
jgi:hypothetical protein